VDGKAPEDWRSPKAGARFRPPGKREASWGAAVPCRFRVQPAPGRFRTGKVASRSGWPGCSEGRARATAPEDWRSPNAGARFPPPGKREASWSAAVPCRFRVQPVPGRFRTGKAASRSGWPGRSEGRAGATAPEDWRSPKAGARFRPPGSREASWSAAVPCRFRVQPVPGRFRRGKMASRSGLAWSFGRGRRSDSARGLAQSKCGRPVPAAGRSRCVLGFLAAAFKN
jgi:hypothetical protein